MFKWFFENVLQDNFWAEGGRKLSVVASIWLYLYIFTEKVLKQENMNTKLFENKYPVTHGFYAHFAHNRSDRNVQ